MLWDPCREGKSKAVREVSGNDPSDIAVGEEATREGLVAKDLVEPCEVGTDAVVPPTQAGVESPFL